MINNSFRLRQVWMIARLQLRRVFFARRSLWVYLLAFFPAIIFIGHGIEVKIKRERWGGHAVTTPAKLDSVREGDTEEEVIAKAGTPITDQRFRRRDEEEPERRYMRYYDGTRQVNLWFRSGLLVQKSTSNLIDFEEDRQVYAGVFQYFYLRLAIFFGCLGIFMNLFRGEMMDKTLHFWMLTPVRREVLLAGKYLAGLIAAVVIFTGGALFCFAAMLWPQETAEVQAFWRDGGASHAFWYAAAAALASLGYGSVFLAAGLLVRNPIIPAAVLLLWEGINGFLPAVLQKLSVLYYVQSLCPVPAPMDSDTPALARMLLAPAEPAPAATAVLGLLAVTALVLWFASRAVTRLEINYSTD
ncbi:MAG: hypothetical protein FJW20_10010 [Acidimicrobiia bacterium]|nr:hypothetical protein [Acidimicrobiia bacterium]